MKKCGTCRHYAPGRNGYTGVCTHAELPHRNSIYLRHSELACRNRDDQDRWEAATEERPAIEPAAVPTPQQILAATAGASW